MRAFTVIFSIIQFISILSVKLSENSTEESYVKVN